jgi:Ketosteroid isomerase homolog
MLRPKEVVSKWIDAFNAGDVDAITNLYHDNAINHQVANDSVVGIDAIREMFINEFKTAKMVCIVENIFEDGQWAILEWKDPLGLRGCGFFQIVNEKILFQRGYWDKLSFLKQHNLPVPVLKEGKNAVD